MATRSAQPLDLGSLAAPARTGLPPAGGVETVTAVDDQGATITTVLVVDDHAGVRVALEALIRNTADLRVLGSASGGEEAIELVAALEPAVVVIDLAMPGTGGVEAIRAICRRRPAPAVIAFSGARTLWREARAAGAAHTVLKDDDPERLLDTIRAAAAARSA